LTALLRLYAAVLEGAPLEQGFAEIVALAGGSSGLMQHAAVAPDGALLGTRLAATPNMNPELMQDYATRWAPLDLWLIETLRRPGRLLEMDGIVSPADWERSPLWNETRHMADAFHAITFLAPGRPGQPSWGFGIHRSRSLGAFSPEQLAAVQAMLPHLSQALQAMLRIEGQGLRQPAQLDAILASLRQPAALMAPRRPAVLHANPAFLALVRAQDGMALALQGRLVLADPEAQRQLEAVLARPLGGEVVARRPSGAMPLLLTSTPLPDGGALLTVTAPDSPPRDDAVPRLIAMFGLSAAEAQLCVALLQGLSPQEHADARGVSITTVRSQIRAALLKCGQSRIAGLVALTARLGAG